MTGLRRLASLRDVVAGFDALVFDQWGVLHDGSTAYPGAVAAIEAVSRGPARLAVLSNSGKRSRPNCTRIARMGFPMERFSCVMTSGEALWRDFATGEYRGTSRLFPLAAEPGDAALWAEGLAGITLVPDVAEADAILLMGLPDDASSAQALEPICAGGLMGGLPMFCSNPDKASPRHGGRLVPSPGALAQTYKQAGGTVRFYGKPHEPVFRSLQRTLGIADPSRILMIGDSLEHDVAGAAAAGWKTLFIEGGLHASGLAAAADRRSAIAALCREHHAPLPDFCMEHVSA